MGIRNINIALSNFCFLSKFMINFSILFAFVYCYLNLFSGENIISFLIKMVENKEFKK